MTDYVNMKRNASGYYDETAYKGMMGIAKPGEVWECVGNSGYASDYLIVKNHEKVCTALKLTNNDNEHSIEMFGMYADPRMVQYIFNDTLSQRKGELADTEFQDVLYSIAFAVGVGEPIERNEEEPPEAAQTESPFSDGDMLCEMLELFGRDAVIKFCVCSIYACRCRGDCIKAEFFYTALKTLRGES